MDLTTAPRGELIRKIYELEDTVVTLEAQLTEIRSRLNQQGPKPQGILLSSVYQSQNTAQEAASC